VQVFIQADCEDARAMLFDGGKNIQIRLCQQLAQAHEAVLKLLQRSVGESNTVEIARLGNCAARLMTAFQQGVLVLRQFQPGQERPTIQQVNVSAENAVVATNINLTRGREE
jgi:hypothetical protein